jgi:hypothetical protein
MNRMLPPLMFCLTYYYSMKILAERLVSRLDKQMTRIFEQRGRATFRWPDFARVRLGPQKLRHSTLSAVHSTTAFSTVCWIRTNFGFQHKFLYIRIGYIILVNTGTILIPKHYLRLEPRRGPLQALT